MNKKQKKHRDAALKREAEAASRRQAEVANQQAMQMMQKQLQEARNPTTPGTQAMSPEDQARLQGITQSQRLAKEAGAKEEQTVRTGLQNAQGFSPEMARLKQYEAHKNVQREAQSAQRNLVGNQGMRGIGGRSGIGYAQRRDLNQQYEEQHRQAQSDYDKLNEAQKYANYGAVYGAGKGEEARFGTDWQEALAREEREKQRKANPNAQQFVMMR